MFSVQVPVAHRDLKSSNIVLKSREECVICDFGLALRLDLSRTADDFAYSGQVSTARIFLITFLNSQTFLNSRIWTPPPPTFKGI
jgi:TGF-beta receptor type-2